MEARSAQCNSPDREVGVSHPQQTNEARRADTNSYRSFGPRNHFQHPTTTLRSWLLHFGPSGLQTNLAKRLSGSLLNSQRNLAQMVFSKRLVRLARFFQPKRSGHVDFERTRIDQDVESVDECQASFSIVRLNGDTVRSSWLGHYTMWICDPPALANR